MGCKGRGPRTPHLGSGATVAVAGVVAAHQGPGWTSAQARHFRGLPRPPHTVISGPEAPVLAGPGMTRERCSRRAGASRWPAGARAGQLWSEAAAPGPGRPRAPTAAARLPEGRGHGGGPQEAWQGAVGGWSARHSLARAWLRGVSRVSGYLPVTQPGSARMGRGQPKQAPRSRA